MKAKRNQKWLEGAKTVSLREFSLLNEGGKFLGTKTFPSVVFIFWVQGILAQASSARPDELTCHFFFFLRGNINHASPSPYGLAFAYLNLLKSELGVDYLFKTNNRKKKLWIQRILGCLAATFSACLVPGRDDGRPWPYPPFASIPKYLQVGDKQYAANRDRSSSYLGWCLPLTCLDFWPWPETILLLATTRYAYACACMNVSNAMIFLVKAG